METPDPPHFGKLVRRHRTAAALSQETLAERAGLSVRAISDLERGVHRAPRLETVRLVADALGLSEVDRAELLAAARPHVMAPLDRERVQPHPLVLLPAPLTRLIGRETEVAAIAQLLAQDEVRLVTLTGPGGTGKTRLALAVAADMVSQYQDGAFFVDLSALTDAALVMPTIAASAGVPEVAGEAMGETLRRALRDRQLLLVLDNVEHLLGAASDIVALLSTCPALVVLATSRVPLHVPGEWEVAVAPLPVPDPDQLLPLVDLAGHAAVALFIERARAARADFRLTSDNARATVAICHRLDGLPLAIELAAAFVKVLPPQALLKRLEQRLPLLAGGQRTLPARQQTMRDAIGWSHDLLTAEEQILFRRLAVFAGGCSLEVAEAVVNPEGTRNVFPGIAGLVDKSLLRQHEGEDGEPRFWMLETVREFAQERLEASGEEWATRDRHAGYFLALLERGDHDILAPHPDQAWLDRIEREHDNVRAALRWSQESGEHDTLLRLAAALVVFWYYHGHLNEGRHWLDQALQTPADVGAPRLRAWALTESGMLANVCGETDLAAELLTVSFDWWERSGDTNGSAIARSLLGGVRVNQGRYDEAASLFGANEAYFRGKEAALYETGHEDWLAHASFHLGVIAWVQGDNGRARSLLRDAVQRYDRSGVPADAIDPLRYLGLLACSAGDLDEAATWFGEMVTRLRQLGSHAAIAVGLADVATLATARAAWQPAVRLFAKAEALLQAEAGAFSLPARDHYDQAHARAAETLGDSAPPVAAAGRVLTLEQALAEAEMVLELDCQGGADAAPAPRGGQ
jgi:predicted ATPase/DNA-binding XRE family transcriptional regulator